jgi:hypothetical protein
VARRGHDAGVRKIEAFAIRDRIPSLDQDARIRLIVELHDRGWSHQLIATSTKLTRRKVADVLARAGA